MSPGVPSWLFPWLYALPNNSRPSSIDLISDIVASGNIGFVVMAAHGSSSSEQYPVARTPAQLISHAPVPLLIVQDRDREQMSRCLSPNGVTTAHRSSAASRRCHDRHWGTGQGRLSNLHSSILCTRKIESSPGSRHPSRPKCTTRATSWPIHRASERMAASTATPRSGSPGPWQNRATGIGPTAFVRALTLVQILR